jgi:hypothetical protein
MSFPRIVALVVGLLLAFAPAFFILQVFGEHSDTRLQAIVAVLLFYGCVVVGVWNQRRLGRPGGYFAFRGAIQAVGILAAIGFFGPFLYAALTHTEAGNLAPIWGVLMMIFGSIAAAGIGLIVYGRQGS